MIVIVKIKNVTLSVVKQKYGKYDYLQFCEGRPQHVFCMNHNICVVGKSCDFFSGKTTFL